MTFNYAAHREKELAALRTSIEKFPAGVYCLELGCGHGHFLTALAQQHRDENLSLHHVGVDKNGERIARAQKKTDRAKLPVFWLNASVADVLEYWPSRCIVQEIFVLFPDPWPRLKQQKHRFVNPTLFARLSEITTPRARFHFRSDNLDYFTSVKNLLCENSQNSSWKIDETISWPQNLPATVFEGHHPVFYSLIAVKGS